MKSTEKESKEKQIRLTFEDTIQCQNKLQELLWQKFKNNDFVHIPEQKEYIDLVNKSFLSNGNWRFCYYNEGNLKIPLGPVHTVCLKMMFVYGPKVKVTRYDFVKVIEIKEIWKIILDELPFIFPAALEESLKTSAETPRGIEASSFEWGHEKGFKND